MSSVGLMAYLRSQSGAHSHHIGGLSSASSALVEQEQYLAELLEERSKLKPFMPVLPHCYRLLNQEILRVTTLLGNASVLDQSGLEHANPLASGGIFSNGGANVDRWASVSPFRSEYNFVGRLLGPRGNSLKRVEASTDCRVLIRGHGSIKDPTKEEMMRGKPGYEHLNEPLHLIVEAELPVEIIDA